MTLPNQNDPPAPERAPSGGRDMRREDWQDEAWLPERHLESTEDSMSKREALARTLYIRWCQLEGIDPYPWEELAGSKSKWLQMVDAILAELREPDDRMLTRGHAEGVRKDFFWERITEQQAIEMRSSYLPTAWQAIIDAITTEPPK